MTHQGGCHCGAVRYTVRGDPEFCSVCHCTDCRKSAGAPFVSWAAYQSQNFKIEWAVTEYHSSDNAYRHFCSKCGTGLYYVNESVLPGFVDIQSATLDDPEAIAPQIQVQVAEQLNWTHAMDQLPRFERYPPAE